MRRFSNIIVFSNGSFGDFLMALFFVQSARRELAPGSRGYIFVPRGGAFLSGFAEAYPGLSVVEASRKNFWRQAFFFFSLACARNLIVMQTADTALPTRVKWFAKTLSLWKGSMFSGFLGNVPEKRPAFGRSVRFEWSIPYIENIRALLLANGIAASEFSPSLAFNRTEPRLSGGVQLKKPYLVLHTFATSVSRSFPQKRWEALLKKILSAHPSLQIVLTGAGNDRAPAEMLRETVSRERIFVALDLHPQELATLIAESALYVGVDTGVTHLACFLRHPSIVIGNRSNPTWLPYYNKNAEVLYDTKRCICTGAKEADCFVEEDGVCYLRCLYDIADERILGAISKKLKLIS